MQTIVQIIGKKETNEGVLSFDRQGPTKTTRFVLRSVAMIRSWPLSKTSLRLHSSRIYKLITRNAVEFVQTELPLIEEMAIQNDLTWLNHAMEFRRLGLLIWGPFVWDHAWPVHRLQLFFRRANQNGTATCGAKISKSISEYLGRIPSPRVPEMTRKSVRILELALLA